MRKYYLLTCMLITSFFLSSCSAKTNETVQPVQTPAEHSNSSESFALEDIIDYVDIVGNSSDYDGKEVIVAGRIAGFTQSPRSFYFVDRIGSRDWFEVRIDHEFSLNESIRDYYSVNDYVIVKGTWYDGKRYKELRDAVVLCTGEEAQKADNVFMQKWEKAGKGFKDTIPITDYMEIARSPNEFNGKRIRTVGEIQSVGINTATWHVYFSFRDTETNLTNISFSLKGCPQDMQDMCKEEGKYVLISGIVEDDFGNPSVHDCYVECVGGSMEEVINK